MAFRAIPGMNGRYSVDEFGRVVSHITVANSLGWRLMSPVIVSGRPAVCLHPRAGQQKIFYVHKLVARAFGTASEEDAVVRHLNDDPFDNSVFNLKGGSVADNVQDSIRNGRNAKLSMTHCSNGHEYTSASTRYTKQGWRECVTCKRARDRRSRQGKRRKRIDN